MKVLQTAILGLLSASLVSGGTITRPTKTCGTTSYDLEFGAGCKTIRRTEIDGDLNTIISTVNGNITAANLATSAVTNAKLGTDSVTSTKIQDAAVTSSKIADGTIVNADINANAAITPSKFVLGFTLHDPLINQGIDTTTTASPPVINTQIVSTGDNLLVTTTAVTATTGIPLIIDTAIAGYITFKSPSLASQSIAVTLRLYRGATILKQSTAAAQFGLDSPSNANIPFTLTIPYTELSTAGALYTLHLYVSSTVPSSTIEVKVTSAALRVIPLG